MSDPASTALDSTLAIIGDVRRGLDEVEAWARAHPDHRLATSTGLALVVMGNRDLEELTPALLDGAEPGTVTAGRSHNGMEWVARQFASHLRVRGLGPSKDPLPVVLNPAPVDPCDGGSLPSEAERGAA